MQYSCDPGASLDNVQDFVRKAKPRALRGIIDFFVWSWGVLILGVAVYVHWPNPFTFCLAFLTVTSRMGALLALGHEAQHSALLPGKKWNDLLGSWLCAYPMGSIFGTSRAVHMAHHKLLNTDEDPDRGFHREDNKNTPRQFILHFAKLICGGQLWTSIIVNGFLRPLGKAPAVNCPSAVVLTRRGYPEILNLVPVQLVIWGTLWLVSGQWWLYFALWLGPIFTFGTFLGFLRGFVDHAKLAVDDDGAAQHRLCTVLHTSLLERWFLAPFDFNYHGEHHLFPSVPHYYLPELHELLQENAFYRSQYGLRESYSKFIADYWQQISAREPASAAGRSNS